MHCPEELSELAFGCTAVSRAHGQVYVPRSACLVKSLLLMLHRCRATMAEALRRVAACGLHPVLSCFCSGCCAAPFSGWSYDTEECWRTTAVLHIAAAASDPLTHLQSLSR